MSKVYADPDHGCVILVALSIWEFKLQSLIFLIIQRNVGRDVCHHYNSAKVVFKMFDT